MMKGAGSCPVPSSRFCSVVARLLVAAIDRVANDDGIAVDGSSRLGDGEAVILGGDEVSGLGLGDVVVSLVDVLVVRLVGASGWGENGADFDSVHHFGFLSSVPFRHL